MDGMGALSGQVGTLGQGGGGGIWTNVVGSAVVTIDVVTSSETGLGQPIIS